MLKVAVIGCGRISVMHFDAIAKLPQAQLVACCDVVKEKADNWANKLNVKAYYDYKEMLDNEELDAIHICLPHYLHVPVAMYAISKKVAVITEKPMSIDYESAVKAVEYAEQEDVTFGVIMQCRYNDSAQFVKKAVESGRVGKILSARSILTWSRPDEYYTKSDWKGTWDKEGGGVVIDQAIHSIDLAHWIINSDVVKVDCSMANRGHEVVEVEDSAEGLVTYANGVKYGFYCMNNYARNEAIEIRFCCEKADIMLNYDYAEIDYHDGRKELIHGNKELITIEGGINYWGHQHIRQIEQFYKACLKQEPLQMSGRVALNTHKLIFAIYDQGKKYIKK